MPTINIIKNSFGWNINGGGFSPHTHMCCPEEGCSTNWGTNVARHSVLEATRGLQIDPTVIGCQKWNSRCIQNCRFASILHPISLKKLEINKKWKLKKNVPKCFSNRIDGAVFCKLKKFCQFFFCAALCNYFNLFLIRLNLCNELLSSTAMLPFCKFSLNFFLKWIRQTNSLHRATQRCGNCWDANPFGCF